MRLTKWYLDATTSAGDLFIGYWASLHLAGINLAIAAELFASESSPPHSQTTLRAAGSPTLTENRLSWNCPSLSLFARYRPLDPPIERILFDSPDGRVLWRCHLPRAHATIEKSNASPLIGLGYAESLELTIEPWRLPIHELYWGRFLSESHSAVWIE